MGDFGANVSEVRGSAGGSLAAGNKKKDKEAEGWFVAADGRKNSPPGSGDTSAPDIYGHETGDSGVVGGPTAYFDVCERETGYEVGGRLWVLWWRQEAAENQLKVTVEAILWVTRVRRQQESDRRGRSEGGRVGGGGARTSKGMGEAGNIGVLRRRQVTPRWADDPVRRH